MATLFFTGYAKLPAGIVASEVSGVVGIGLELDPDGRIVRADCTLATALGRDFFRRIVAGHHLVDDAPGLSEQVTSRYHGTAQKALVAALRMARERYIAYRDASWQHSP